MVVTKHFAIHGANERNKKIKYVIRPDKTNGMTLVSDYGINNYLDWPIYEDLVKMYKYNFEINDTLYEKRNDRLQLKQKNISMHHLIQSFSPDDKLTPEEINRIGYETFKELTGGRFRFIVATHVDKEHIHNHILINAIDMNSDKKLKWDYSVERNMRMISDRISKMAGAKIIENPERFSYTKYQTYKQSSHRYELKQCLNFLLRHSDNFKDFKEKAQELHVQIDFSKKHSRFFMPDRKMKQVIRGDNLNRRLLYDFDFFAKYFSGRQIKRKIEFLLEHSRDLSDFLLKAEQLGVQIHLKKKNVDFTIGAGKSAVTLNNHDLSKNISYNRAYFEDYFDTVKVKSEAVLDGQQLIDAYQEFESQQKSQVTVEGIRESYKLSREEKENQATFELVLEDWQIEKEVESGIYIKVWFGVEQEGLVYIPNTHLDMIQDRNQEEKFKIYLTETDYYFIYDKHSAEKNRYIMGKTLLRQLADETQQAPLRKWISKETIEQKIIEINLLVQLNISDRSYQEIKDDLVRSIAQQDLKVHELNGKLLELNKISEVLAGLESEDEEIVRMSKYSFSKMNLTESLTFEDVEQQVDYLQEELTVAVDEYEEITRRMDKFVKLLKQYNRDDSEQEEQGQREQDSSDIEIE